MKFQRRHFLLGGIGAVAVAGFGAWGFGRMGLQAHVASVVRRRLAFLQLDDAGVRAYAHDQVTAMFDKHIPTWNRMKYHFQSVFATSFKRYSRSADQRSKTIQAEDAFIQTYLLSSDFFRNGSDESRVVMYVAYFDPMRACSNPFARSAVAA